VKTKLDVVVVVVLAVVLWTASHRSSAECPPLEEDSSFALTLVDAGGDAGWPEQATLVVWAETSTPSVSVDLGKQGVVHAKGN
jgi:hypothetical protein